MKSKLSTNPISIHIYFAWLIYQSTYHSLVAFKWPKLTNLYFINIDITYIPTITRLVPTSTTT